MPLGHLRATRRRLGQDRKFDIGHQRPSPPSFHAQRLRLLLAQHQGPGAQGKFDIGHQRPSLAEPFGHLLLVSR
jgi:hypothetical protein